MSPLRLVVAGLRHYWPAQLALAVGAAVATAVITGALVVGDSMRGSLRDLALDRLGRVEAALVAPGLFRSALADETERRLAERASASQPSAVIAPALLLPCSAESTAGQPRRAGRVQLIGCDRRFFSLVPMPGGDPRPPAAGETFINAELAERLGVEPGDSILVRIAQLGGIPAESALGKKQETVETLRVRVAAIVSGAGAGQFALRPSQQTTPVAYLSLEWLCERLDHTGKANALLAGGRSLSETEWNKALEPQLDDFGLTLRADQGYVDLSSQQMVIEPALEAALSKRLAGGVVQPVLTYLANTLAVGDRSIPYSTVSAVDLARQPPLGPLSMADGKPIAPLSDEEIVLNRWAADQLAAKPGDTIRLDYFEPETSEGRTVERSARFRLKAVAEMTGQTIAAGWTPEVRGITDRQSIAQWNPPFPFDARRVRPADEEYWNRYRATPKAFVSLAAGRRLWASRFGQTTSLRVVGSAAPIESLELQPEAGNLHFRPVRAQALAAAQGTTPFGVLFLMFSFFLIAAALMLVSLLFRLSVEARASQIGLLAAVGLPSRVIGRLLRTEAMIVALVALAPGLLLGVIYAQLLVLGLTTWWVQSITVPFLSFHVEATSLLMGGGAGLALSYIVLARSASQFARREPRGLLAGRLESQTFGRVGRPWGVVTLTAMLVIGLAVALVAPVDEATKAGLFFTIGMLALASYAAVVWRLLRQGRTGAAIRPGRRNLLPLAVRDAARHPTRSALSIGLMASASFIIVAVSAFQLDPGRVPIDKATGNGGFALLAESDQPIYHDVNSADGRRELGFSADESRQLDAATIIGLRVAGGDDASCLNLYRPRQPRLLGVNQRLAAWGGFAWSALPSAHREHPWRALSSASTGADGVPIVNCIVDQSTAAYSLGLWRGVGETFDIVDGQGKPLRLQVAGLLNNSIFQGSVLIDDEALLAHFPAASGQRYFLVATTQAAADAALLDRMLGDYGFQTTSTTQRLAALAAVQNTYLAAFRSLGGLGLLLGGIGVAVVQLRNVLARQREFALLVALGWSRRQVQSLVRWENVLLLSAGLLGGLFSAVLAISPQLVRGQAGLPWMETAATVLVVFAVGMTVGQWAAGRAARAIPALTLRGN